MPLQQTSGNVTADAYGGGVAAVPNYIEDVFSTWVYTGTGNGSGTSGTVATITNGIDLSTNGGLVWIKNRGRVTDHGLYDTARGALNGLQSNGTSGQSAFTNTLTAFTTSGFSLGNDGSNTVNLSGDRYASWTFRKQPKFFDVVTYTGNGSSPRNIAHNLGSTPGCMIVKSTSTANAWYVWHTSLGASYFLTLSDTTAAQPYGSFTWASTNPTSTQFTTGVSLNANGTTYVAYLFAHNAGGFGLTGTDNVISCGSFTTNGSGNVSQVSLGYEPQWVLYKTTDVADNWRLVDSMRGMPVTAPTGEPVLKPNLSDAEQADAGVVVPNATGFSINGGSPSFTYIYIAIRRGPMKVPTVGTSVFSPNTANASAGTAIVTNFPVDLSISVATNGDTRYFSDRLRGVNSPGYTANQPWIASDSTGAELTNASIPRGWDNTQILLPPYYAGGPTVWWNFRRAPSFFDEVCYTGTGSAMTIPHNLGVAPEFIIAKMRLGSGQNWVVYHSAIGPTGGVFLNLTNATGTSAAYWNNTAPTATNVYNYGWNWNGASGYTYVMYLFATCAGVSKVGSYTGNGTTQTINCGFTGGARFVLIKRTDSTGDWYVYDTARGMTVLTDPYLLLNSTAAESATLGSVTTVSTGFAVNASILAAINTNAASYIFLAIS